MSVGQRVLQPDGRFCSDASHIVKPIKTISVTTIRARTLSLKTPPLLSALHLKPLAWYAGRLAVPISIQGVSGEEGNADQHEAHFERLNHRSASSSGTFKTTFTLDFVPAASGPIGAGQNDTELRDQEQRTGATLSGEFGVMLVHGGLFEARANVGAAASAGPTANRLVPNL
jgi:hypothetical protein